MLLRSNAACGNAAWSSCLESGQRRPFREVTFGLRLGRQEGASHTEIRASGSQLKEDQERIWIGNELAMWRG